MRLLRACRGFCANMWSLINGEEFRRRRAAIIEEYERKQLALHRRIVERAWNEASGLYATMVPGPYADRIIEAAKRDLKYVPHTDQCSTWDLRPCNCKGVL